MFQKMYRAAVKNKSIKNVWRSFSHIICLSVAVIYLSLSLIINYIHFSQLLPLPQRPYWIFRVPPANFFRNSNNDIEQQLSEEGISWHFVPPHSPNFGGLWEAGIKSVKFHLRRVVGNALLTLEEFYTVLAQIEAVLNSRPLPLDPNDLEPLTPSHFLMGRTLTSVPEAELPINKYTNNSGKDGQLSTEYISEMQFRIKWKEESANIQVDSLVLLKEDNLPPTKWLLDRVEALHPVNDGVCRVVIVKTAKGVFKGPVRKMCPLPICCDLQDG